ncbi:MAG: Ig-like domain-containing protein [Erysipelotrichales bacterium]|nr:Ig-like domain-containing protein [Erysipelotrichales bacterium]
MKRVHQGKFLTVILVLIMVMVTIFPAVAAARDEEKDYLSNDIYIETTDIVKVKENEPQNLYVGNTAIIDNGTLTNNKISGVKYLDGILYLNNATINNSSTFEEKDRGIYSDTSITISLEGNNIIDVSSENSIFVLGELHIIGSGSLESINASTAIRAKSIILEQSGIIDISCAYQGLQAQEGDILIQEGSISIVNTKGWAYGIYTASGDLNVKGGNVKINTKNVDAQSCYINGNVLFSGGTFETVGVNPEIYVRGNCMISKGDINTKKIRVENNGIFTMYGGTLNIYNDGVITCLNDINILGGHITFAGSKIVSSNRVYLDTNNIVLGSGSDKLNLEGSVFIINDLGNLPYQFRMSVQNTSLKSARKVAYINNKDTQKINLSFYEGKDGKNVYGKGSIAYTNGGTIPNTTIIESSKYDLVAPIKERSIFEGWYDNEDFHGEAVTSFEADKTYYAKWTGIEPLEIRYSDTEKIKVTGEVADLSGWTSDNTDVATVDHNGNVTGKNVGTANISVSGMYQGQRITFTTTVTVNPMQIIYGPADKSDPTTGLPYLSYVPENGKAPLISDMLGFYPVRKSEGDLPFEADTDAPRINLVPGTDVEYIYESEGQTITTDTLPIRPTTGEDSIRVKVRLKNENYQFCTMGTEWKPEDTITLFVDVYKEGMKEIKMLIDGKIINMYEEHQHYEYTGEGIIPTDKDLTKLRTENDIIREFTVHFHAVKENTRFVSTHLRGKASELKREEVKKLAPKEIGVYSFVINGSDKEAYSYVSRRYEIVKGIPKGEPIVEKVNRETKLSEVEIKGRMVNGAGKEVGGKFEWNNPETGVEQGREYRWTFTPEDTEHYETVSGESEVWEDKKEPEIPEKPEEPNIDIEQNEKPIKPEEDEKPTQSIEESVKTEDNIPDMLGSVLLMLVGGLGMIYLYKKSYRHY